MDVFLRILYAIGLLGVLVVFYVLFPIWASKFAKKRGLKGLGTAAIVSIFVCLGPLGGLVALLGSAYRPLVGEFQAECPECGSEAVKAYLNAVDRNTGEELGAPFHIWLSSALFFFIAASLFLTAWGLYDEFFEWGELTGPFPATLFFVSGVASLWNGISKTRKYYHKDRARLIKHKCRDCDHTWNLCEVEFSGTSTA